MPSRMPTWRIPKDIASIVEEEEMWEDDAWAPLQLTVLGGTSYKGRDIPLSWQIEFEPSAEEFQEANGRLVSLGLDPDGYGWAKLIDAAVRKHHPEISDELQFGDTEESACVVWVESEATCKTLMQVVWNLCSSK